MLRSTIHLPPIEEGEFLLHFVKEDIFYLEVDSLDNELLKYANEKIEG